MPTGIYNHKPNKPSQNRNIGIALQGRTFTEEHKERLSIARQSRIITDETREKLSITHQGKTLSDKTRKKISVALQERAPTVGFTGMTHSLDARRAISEALQGLTPSNETKGRMSQAHKLQWKDPTYRERVIRATIRGNRTKPTVPEQRLIDLIENCGFPLAYNGGRANLIIEGLCPDFYGKNGTKCILEIYGDYWHKNDMKNREEIYAKHGYKTLILWESEIESYTGDVLIGFLVDLLQRRNL